MFRIPSQLGAQGSPASGSAWLRDNSRSNMHWKPGPISIAALSFDPLAVLADFKKSSWSAIKKALETLFGGQTFAIGAVYGAGESIVTSVADLLGLMKTLALADLADSVFRRKDTPWYQTAFKIFQPFEMAKEIAGMVGGHYFKAELQAAQADRDVLVASLRYALQHPAEVLGGIGNAYVDKWNRFEALIVKTDLRSRFDAGKIFGEVLLEVLGLLAAGAGLAKLAAKVPGFARIATRLGKASKSLKTKLTPGSRKSAPKTPAPVRRPSSGSVPPTSSAANPPTKPKGPNSTLASKEAIASRRVYRESFYSKEPLVIGRLDDTAAGAKLGMRRLNDPDWTINVNDAWIQGGIDAQKPFYLGSNISISNLRSGNPIHPKTVFFRELEQLRAAGYQKQGNWMMPPKR
jgi:hypothetical protein